MSRTKLQTFFHWVWRLDAILIFIAAAAASFTVIAFLISNIGGSIRGRDRQPQTEAPPVAAGKEATELHLGGLVPIEGTMTFKANLSSERRGTKMGYSSGDSSDVRNILFIDFATGRARWLLPSNKELITRDLEVADASLQGGVRPPAAEVVLAKPDSPNRDVEDGRLLLLDPTAQKVTEIATGVHDVDSATVTPAGQIAILFESQRKYQLAFFDRSSLAKVKQSEVIVPRLQ